MQERRVRLRTLNQVGSDNKDGAVAGASPKHPHQNKSNEDTSARAGHATRASASHKSKSSAKPDYEKLGKMLFAIGESGTTHRRRLYKIAFWKGIWHGLGSALGATIVVAVLLWVIIILGRIPIIGPAIDLISDGVNARSTTIKPDVN